MAQPTLGTRPATWAGTSNPILYKFTSTNYAEAGYRMEVEVWNATTAAKIADANYYPNSTGSVTVDISSFLKANMSLLNNSDLTSGSVYTDNNWIKYYIKYQEVWTASSETQVNDVANLRYAIYGGLQLGVINSFNPIYFDVVFSWLTQSGLYFVKNYPYTFSHISHPGAYLRVQRYLLGSSLNVTDTLISNDGVIRGKHTETGTADKIELSIVAKAITLGALSTFTNQGSGTNWTTGANPSFMITGVFAATKKLSAAFAGIAGVEYSFAYDIDLTVTGTELQDVYIVLMDASFNVIVSSPIGHFGSGNYAGTANLTPTSTAAHVGIYALLDDSGVGTTTGDVNSFSQTGSADEIISDVKTVLAEEECNTVMLQWKNSLGGDECFPFCCNQEYTFHYSDRKAKRLTLYADNLTLAQWEAIQGLNTLGELYKTPIVELTTSIDRTMATIGQAVYVLNSDGTKTGVNVIGSPNTTNTKQKKHSAFVTIEYPEQFLQ